MFFSLCLLLTSELLIKKNTLGSITLTQKPEVNPFYCLFVHMLTSLEPILQQNCSTGSYQKYILEKFRGLCLINLLTILFTVKS